MDPHDPCIALANKLNLINAGFSSLCPAPEFSQKDSARVSPALRLTPSLQSQPASGSRQPAQATSKSSAGHSRTSTVKAPLKMQPGSGRGQPPQALPKFGVGFFEVVEEGPQAARMLLDPKTKTKLEVQGKNFEFWLAETLAMAQALGCLAALEEARPGSQQDGVAMLLILPSVPLAWVHELYGLGSAHAAFQHVRAKFQGGHNRKINEVWMRELCKGKKRKGESLAEFASRQAVLARLLQGNGHRSILTEAGFADTVLDCLTEQDLPGLDKRMLRSDAFQKQSLEEGVEWFKTLDYANSFYEGKYFR
eukprot:jgi/Botrbrau1/21334/Bobra.0184s0044.1